MWNTTKLNNTNILEIPGNSKQYEHKKPTPWYAIKLSKDKDRDSWRQYEGSNPSKFILADFFFNQMF